MIYDCMRAGTQLRTETTDGLLIRDVLWRLCVKYDFLPKTNNDVFIYCQESITDVLSPRQFDKNDGVSSETSSEFSVLMFFFAKSTTGANR